LGIPSGNQTELAETSPMNGKWENLLYMGDISLLCFITKGALGVPGAVALFAAGVDHNTT